MKEDFLSIAMSRLRNYVLDEEETLTLKDWIAICQIEATLAVAEELREMNKRQRGDVEA